MTIDRGALLFQIPGARLTAMLKKRREELDVELAASREIEAQPDAEEVRDSVGRARMEPAPYVPHRGSVTIMKSIESLNVVLSLLSPTETYACTLVDLARLDLITIHDAQGLYL
jgi:hypothetical protein